MKRIIALFLIIPASFAWGAIWETAVVNGITWTYSSAEDGVKLGYHVPKMLTEPAINKSTSGSIVIPAALNGRNVTQIGVAAFGGCSNLTSVTIPFGVKIIDDSAFSGCVKLKTITILGSVKSIGDYAFDKCSSLTGIQIPNSVTNIGEGAFRKCSSLESVVFPSPLKNIPKSMFEDCVGLKSIDIPNGITNICDSAFVRCTGLTRVSVADSVERIEMGAFSYCGSLKDVTIGSGVEYIGTAAFLNCREIENISLNDWTRLDVGAFRGCGKLRSIEIPSATSSIRDHTFCDCSNLVSVTSLNVSSIEESAFANCVNLKSVEINARKIADKAFYGCSGLTNISFSSQLSSIGDRAFSFCSGFSSLLLPDVTKSIGKSAFRGCSNLKNVVLGKELETFGDEPFYDCNSIESLTIPQLICSIASNGVAQLWSSPNGNTPSSLTNIAVHEGVVSIANSTFGMCYSLRRVLIPESVVSIDPYAFYYCHYYNGVIDERYFSCNNLQTFYIPKNYNGSLPYLSLSVPSGLVECRYNPHQVVSLDANGGTVSPSSLTVNFASPYGNLPTPVRTGYDFSGWMYGGKCVNSSTSVAALDNHTLTAQWTPKNYQVSFDANGGEGGWSQAMEYGAAIEPPTVTREGYTFAGWSPSVSATVPAKDVSYIAQWTANRYTVRFDANGGDGVMEDVTGAYDGEALALTNCFTRLGYSVVGWATSGDGDMVYQVGQSVGNLTSQNGGMVTLYAIWMLNKYHVTFDANGGNGGWSELMDYGAVIVPPTVTREGHTFEGWSSSVPVTVPAGDVRCVAQWAVNKYVITFDANGGEGGWTQELEYGSDIVAPSVMRAGYMFAGWIPSAALTVPASNMTYTARWLKEEGVTTFDIVGGVLTKVALNGNTGVIIPDGVTRIESGAFSGCSALEYVSIPDSVTSIGNDAFTGCKVLEKRLVNPFEYIVLVDGWVVANLTVDYLGYGYQGKLTGHLDLQEVRGIADNAFKECRDITSVVIAEGARGIGAYAFYGCRSLTDIEIPNSVTEVGDYAFHGTPFLSRQPDGLAVFGTVAYSMIGSSPSTVVIPDGLSRIAAEAFKGCSGLVSLTIPDSVKSIGQMAFYECWRLASVIVGNGLTSIDGGAFSRCYSITSINIPNSVLNIGDDAFVSCNDLVSITIGSGVTNIGDRAFSWCNSLRSITFNGDAPDVGEICFDRVSDLCVAYVNRESSGWEVDEAGKWNGLLLRYINEYEEPTISYQVTFDANGGDGGWSELMNYGAAIVPPTVTRVGYTFAGWSPSVAATVPAEDVTYTAQWTLRNFVVQFDANGGTGGWNRTMEYGAAIVPPTVTRVGYTFAGWSPSVSATVPAEDITYIARWTANSYTVKFDANGGDGVMEDVIGIYDGEALSLTNCFTRLGYSVAGWYSVDGDMVYLVGQSVVNLVSQNGGEITLYAIWTPNQYSVSFDANGGVGGWSRTMRYGAAIEPPTVTREGYAFSGWSPSVAMTVPAGDVTYTAQWTPKGYMVRFDANGGIGGWSQMIKYGATIEPPIVTREGYTFAGWSPTVAATVPAEDITYIARWTANRYTVKFDANGGEGVMDDVTGIYDGEALSLTNCFTRLGYSVVGWATSVDGDVVYPVGQSVENLVLQNGGETTLYAIWTPNQYSVSFDANGGMGGWTRTMEYGAAIVPPTVTRTGYTFAGWSPSSAATVPAEDVTYTAQWSVNMYTVTFDANGGEGGWSRNMEYGALIEPPTVTRDGYEFLGWSPSPSLIVPWVNVTYTAQWKDLDEGKDLDTEPHFSIAPFETIISNDDGWYYTNLNMLVAVDLNGNTEISLPETIAKINDRAFSGCASLKCLTVPSSVSEIGWRAFTGCRDLKIIFNGDAPNMDGDGIGASDCTAYVKQSASGWYNNGDFKRLVHMSESIRELSIYDDEEWRITQKIVYTGFVDEDAIISVINGNADEYRRFKAWAQSTDDGEAAVIMSTRAAKSYLLGAKALLDKELTSDDVKIESFSPTVTDGKFEFTVSVKDVNIGGGSVETETLKANLKKVLGVEGAATLTPSAFSSDNIDITFGSPVNGKAKISVSPPADAGNSFFMRVKVK